MMYRCNDCGITFENGKIVCDKVPYGNTFIDGPKREVCPYCEGDFEKAEICLLCGDYYSDSKHDNICPNCIRIIESRFSKVLASNFSPFEIEVLNTIYEGRNFK